MPAGVFTRCNIFRQNIQLKKVITMANTAPILSELAT